jgi:hypothetical protein
MAFTPGQELQAGFDRKTSEIAVEICGFKKKRNRKLKPEPLEPNFFK